MQKRDRVSICTQGQGREFFEQPQICFRSLIVKSGPGVMDLNPRPQLSLPVFLLPYKEASVSFFELSHKYPR
jgi:hypothetical protein